MKVGICAPINYLDLCVTKVYPCYAKFAVTSEKYLNFFRSKKGMGTVILDTSPKLPRENNLDVLFHASRLIEPNLIVLPSRDYSYDRTVGLAQSFIQRSGADRLYIGVVQGNNLDTLLKCYTALKEYCSVIGLPSVLEAIAKRSEIVRDLHIKEQVVLIEVYTNPYEEIHQQSNTVMLTSLPIRLACDSRRLVEYSPTPPPLDYEAPKGELPVELAQDNIEEYLEVVE